MHDECLGVWWELRIWKQTLEKLNSLQSRLCGPYVEPVDCRHDIGHSEEQNMRRASLHPQPTNIITIILIALIED